MNRLREIRRSRGLTMKQLGALVNVSEAAIGYYETGKRSMNYEMLLKLGEALNCSVSDIIEGKKEPATESDGLVQEPLLNWTDKDIRLLMWFRSLPTEKQQAILTAQDAPEGLL